MKASIVVPSRGGRERLPLLLASIEGQTHADVEVVIVLDGDIDDSEQMLAERATTVPMKVITFPENKGRPSALNAGFTQAQGDVLIRCDDDFELEADFVSRHVRHHESARCGVVGVTLDVDAGTPYSRAYGQAADRDLVESAGRTPPERAWTRWSGNISTTAEVHRLVGPYDEAFRAYGWEDVEWGYRLHLLGIPIVIDTAFTTLHHGPVTSTVERATRAFAAGAARRRFEHKHGSGALPSAARDRGAWDRLVEGGAAVLTEGSVAGTARVIDTLLPAMPRWVGRKSVAMLVESASLAGRRGPRG